MKGIYQRGKVHWFRYSFNGKQFRESLDTEDEAVAIKRARAIIESPERVKAGLFQIEMRDYFADVVRRGVMRANTGKSRTFTLAKFAKEYEIGAPSDITKSIVEEWYSDLLDEHSARTAKDYVEWLRVFLQWLVDKKKLRQNPAEGIEYVRPRMKFKQRFVSKDEIARLIDACTDKQLKCILFLGFDCGLRKEEIIEVRPSWFNFDAGTLQVQSAEDWEPKDFEHRVVPLTTRFQKWLKEEYWPLPSPYLIEPKAEKKKRRARYRYDARKPLARFMESQGMEWVGFKVMRQSFGSVMVSSGVELARVSRWMGHSSVDTTMNNYISFVPNDGAIDKGVAQSLIRVPDESGRRRRMGKGKG